MRSTSRANAGSPQRPASRGWSRRWRRTCWASSARARCAAGRITGPGSCATIDMAARWQHHINARVSGRQRRVAPARPRRMPRSPAAYHDGGSHRSCPRGASSPRHPAEGVRIGGWRHRHAGLRGRPGGRVRLHEWLPRHRQLDRHVRRHARTVARLGDPDGHGVQLHRRVRRDRGRHDHRERPRQ